jgi:TRAP-type C4-dicarboxylate transport system permease small subunit
MRRSLDFLYRLSGALAASFLVGICLVVVLQVGANIVDTVFRQVRGEPLGLVVPSYAEFTGFLLVAVIFLALASSLRAGSHIRVSLVINRFGPRTRRWIELWCTASGAALAVYFAVFSIDMVLDSIAFNDVSPGIVAVPIWIPQSTMALGLIVFSIAMIDELVTVIRGRTPAYAKGDQGELSGSRQSAAGNGDQG